MQVVSHRCASGRCSRRSEARSRPSRRPAGAPRGMSSLTALTRLPIGVVRSDPELRRLLQQVMDETAALARAEGVALADDFVARQMTVVDGLPAQAKASMANDLDAG